MTDAVGFATSRAVLIGVAEYQDSHLANVPAAANSLREMYSVLTDPGIGCWPPERVEVVADPESPTRLIQRLRRIAEQTSGALLLYFVGHGLLDPQGHLCLALSETELSDPDVTGIEYAKIKSLLHASPAAVRIVILDCCYSGQVINGVGEMLSADTVRIADSAHVKGVYTLTAAEYAAHVVPLADQADVCTTFTGELVGLLRSGLPSAPRELTLHRLYPELQSRLLYMGMPAPNQRGTDTASHFVIARNAAYSPRMDIIDYFEAEVAAVSICSYEPVFIPDLMLTEGYARAVIEAQVLEPSVDDGRAVEDRIRTRIARSRRLWDEPEPLTAHFIIHEAVLRHLSERSTSERSALHEGQLDHMITMSRRPNVTIQIIPYYVGPYAGMELAFALLDFGPGSGWPTASYTDSLNGRASHENIITAPSLLRRFEQLSNIALSPRASMLLLMRMARGNYDLRPY